MAKKISPNLRPFPKGHTGRPLGAKNKTTLLKEKILEAALGVNLNGGETLTTKQGKKLVKRFIRNIPEIDILKLGASFVPKEVKQDIEGSIEIGWME